MCSRRTRTAVWKIPDSFRAIQTRKNASVPAIAAQIGDPFGIEIRNYWRICVTNVQRLGRDVALPFIRAYQCARAFEGNGTLLEEVGKQLTQLDLGIGKLELRSVETFDPDFGPRQESYLCTQHKMVGHEDYCFLPLEWESEGSINLVAFLLKMIPALSEGGLCVLDEMDADIHPLVIPNLLDQFLSAHRNPKNAQLLCSCHSAPVLNHLDKYQILLTEKDSEGRTHVWRLDDMPKVRVDDNYYAKYMAGTYGGNPEHIRNSSGMIMPGADRTTILVVGEGDTECAFLRHLKSLEEHRGSRSISIRSARFGRRKRVMSTAR